MTNQEKLEYLMEYNKKSLKEAQSFVDAFKLDAEKANREYWEGRKAQAELNIRILQTMGISAKEVKA